MPARSSTIQQDLWNLPNILTMARIAVIPVICVLLAIDKPMAGVAAAALFGAAAATDWLDGYIARKRALVSLTGKFLDPLADKLLVMAVIVTMVAHDRLPVWFVTLLLAREMSVTGLRALAAAEGLILAADWGGKWKTAFQLVGLVCLIIQYCYTIDFGLFSLDVRFDRVGFLLLLLSLLYSLASGWGYFRSFLRSIEERAAPPSEVPSPEGVDPG